VLILGALHASLSYRGDVFTELLKLLGKQYRDAPACPLNVWLLVQLASIPQYNKQVNPVSQWPNASWLCMQPLKVWCLWLTLCVTQAVTLWKKKVLAGQLTIAGTTAAFKSCATALQSYFGSTLSVAEVRPYHPSSSCPVLTAPRVTLFSYLFVLPAVPAKPCGQSAGHGHSTVCVVVQVISVAFQPPRGARWFLSALLVGCHLDATMCQQRF
jgi:hypothetical protein